MPGRRRSRATARLSTEQYTMLAQGPVLMEMLAGQPWQEAFPGGLRDVRAAWERARGALMAEYASHPLERCWAFWQFEAPKGWDDAQDAEVYREPPWRPVPHPRRQPDLLERLGLLREGEQIELNRRRLGIEPPDPSEPPQLHVLEDTT